MPKRMMYYSRFLIQEETDCGSYVGTIWGFSLRRVIGKRVDKAVGMRICSREGKIHKWAQATEFRLFASV
ncbi:unnamed protein product [Cylicostephanus goldi]|uniref:Uncharacterized protein n=1 Tax=Cylicostephanus goldi TaxID=71465 RepID=A0A3P7QMM1_CYLGO|nr:unnamed protein product [Cylicostephanus goldi]